MDNTEIRFQNVTKSKTFKNLIEIFQLDKKAVLDVGCSYGEFLVHFGPGSLGLTIIKREVEIGNNRGLNVQYGNIESDDFMLPGGGFDVIFANNIFEHLLSPHTFLIKVKKYLKPNGIFILGVPCIPKIVSLLRFRKFQGSLYPLHINFFTKETLTKTVEAGGYKILMTRGFHFRNTFLDKLLDPIYPHMYIIAEVDKNFQYNERRMEELEAYKL